MDIKVCHITTAHSAKDVRIFKKECTSLSKNGYDVSLLAVNCENEISNGVKIHSVNVKVSSRLERFIKVPKALYKLALEVDADIYHFHDPDFVFYAYKLMKRNKVIVYDIHEDYPIDIRSKSWIPFFLRPLISYFYKLLERKFVSKYSANISVTPQIVSRIKKYNRKTYQVTNYPLLDNNLLNNKINISSKNIVFAGTISPLRNIHKIIDVLEEINDFRFILAGAIDKNYRSELEHRPGWKFVDFRGKISYDEVLSIYKDSYLGVVIEDYGETNYGNEGSLGVVKLFEYMMVGLPFIATDFALHKEIIDEYECGITVNPNNKNEILDAIKFLINNPLEAQEMGKRGQLAIKEKYNWMTQEKILIDIYSNLIK